MTGAVYVDSSALVKLIVVEAESNELLRYLADSSAWVASSLAIVEVGRAVSRRSEIDVAATTEVLARLTLVDARRDILERAAGLAPATLRSLDAIHVATAIEVRDSIEAVVTYDLRLADAVRTHGFSPVSPGGAAA
jgi:predicted nucleic acid-binding protein